MKADKFIQPRDVKIGERTFVVSKIPAIDALPIHNVVAKAIVDNGLLGITMLQPVTDLAILRYTAVRDSNDRPEPLDSDIAVSVNFEDGIEDMKALVIEMVKENFGFLINGDLLGRFPLPVAGATESAS